MECFSISKLNEDILGKVCLNKLITELKFEYRELEDNTGCKYIEQRGTNWFSDKGYTFVYSNKIMEPKTIPKCLNSIINNIKIIYNIDYDGILVNLYKNGQVTMGWHVDPLYNEWIDDSVIVSLGSTRILQFRENKNMNNKIEFEMCNGRVIRMYNGCQEKWSHRVKKSKTTESRISIVLKKHK